jgi:hypothetical protein
LRPYNVPVSAYRPPASGTGYNDPKPNAASIWAAYANNPSQREMTVTGYCDATSKNMTPQQRFSRSVDRMYSFRPTKERYNASKARQIDIRSWAKSTYPRNFANPNLPRVTYIRGQVKYLIMHFTVSTNQATTGKTQASIMHAMNSGTGYQYYINDTGSASNTWYTTDQFAYHVLGKSIGAFGVEIAACSQDDITGREYEEAIYLAASFMEKHGYITKSQSVTAFVNNFVQGHREYGKGVHSDWPKAITDVFKQRLINFLVQGLGYKR